jgi:hypothetical protein
MNNSTIKLNPKQFSKGRTNNNVLQFLLQEQVFDEPVFTHFRAGNKKVVKRKITSLSTFNFIPIRKRICRGYSSST